VNDVIILGYSQRDQLDMTTWMVERLPCN